METRRSNRYAGGNNSPYWRQPPLLFDFFFPYQSTENVTLLAAFFLSCSPLGRGRRQRHLPSATATRLRPNVRHIQMHEWCCAMFLRGDWADGTTYRRTWRRGRRAGRRKSGCSTATTVGFRWRFWKRRSSRTLPPRWRCRRPDRRKSAGSPPVTTFFTNSNNEIQINQTQLSPTTFHRQC